MRLGGWHRLWVVSSTVYLVVVLSATYPLWVEPIRLPYVDDRLVNVLSTHRSALADYEGHLPQ